MCGTLRGTAAGNIKWGLWLRSSVEWGFGIRGLNFTIAVLLKVGDKFLNDLGLEL